MQVTDLISNFPVSTFKKSPGQHHKKEGASAHPAPPGATPSRLPITPPSARKPECHGWRESALWRHARQTDLVPISREEGTRIFGEPRECKFRGTGPQSWVASCRPRMLIVALPQPS